MTSHGLPDHANTSIRFEAARSRGVFAREGGQGHIRARFWKEGGIAEDAPVTLDVSDRFGADALKRVLVVLGRVPHDPLAIAAFTRASHALAGLWTSDGDLRGGGHRNFHTESDVSQRTQEFLLSASPEAARQVLAPLLAAVDRHSRELQSVLQR